MFGFLTLFETYSLIFIMYEFKRIRNIWVVFCMATIYCSEPIYDIVNKLSKLQTSWTGFLNKQPFILSNQ